MPRLLTFIEVHVLLSVSVYAAHHPSWRTLSHLGQFLGEHTAAVNAAQYGKEACLSGHDRSHLGIRLVTEDAVFTVDPQFLSVALGVDQTERDWKGINFTSLRVINMAKGLNPAMLRLGGTRADFLLFNASSLSKEESKYFLSAVKMQWRLCCCFFPEENATFGPLEWDAINQFVDVADWEFIFGLNSLLRSPYPVGVWAPNNAHLLMSYSNAMNYTVDWELGNGTDIICI